MSGISGSVIRLFQGAGELPRVTLVKVARGELLSSIERLYPLGFSLILRNFLIASGRDSRSVFKIKQLKQIYHDQKDIYSPNSTICFWNAPQTKCEHERKLETFSVEKAILKTRSHKILFNNKMNMINNLNYKESDFYKMDHYNNDTLHTEKYL